jgi:hypothetical protein
VRKGATQQAHGAGASDSCAVAHGASARTKPYKFKSNSEKGLQNLTARKIHFRGELRGAQERFQVWKHLAILLEMNSITLFYVIDLIMSS